MVYAYLAIGIALALLSAACYGLYYKAKAAEERADQVTQALQESEEAAEALRVAARVLDQQLADIRKREDKLNAQKRQLQGQLDAIAAALPAPDRDCLGRDLPDALSERLRNESSSHKDGKAEGPAKPAGAVPEVRP
jgi:chromosome segregation ATPase